MITRPLDLLTKLRRPPRNFDVLFFVNIGVLALFFALFGSRFVLSPGLGVDFNLPDGGAGAMTAASPTDVVIAVVRSDMALVDGVVLDFPRLKKWLMEKAAVREGQRLLVQANRDLSASDLTTIYEMAREAGFAGVQIAAEPSAK